MDFDNQNNDQLEEKAEENSVPQNQKKGEFDPSAMQDDLEDKVNADSVSDFPSVEEDETTGANLSSDLPETNLPEPETLDPQSIMDNEDEDKEKVETKKTDVEKIDRNSVSSGAGATNAAKVFLTIIPIFLLASLAVAYWFVKTSSLKKPETYVIDGGGDTGGIECNEGEWKSECTGSCGGCPDDAGEAKAYQCNNGNWEFKHSECKGKCKGPCEDDSNDNNNTCGADIPECQGKDPGDSCGTNKECNSDCQCIYIRNQPDTNDTCGADVPECQGKNPGDSCGTNKTCNVDCQCVDSRCGADVPECQGKYPGNVCGTNKICNSNCQCINSTCGADVPECQGKNPGDSCGTNKTCNYNCQCIETNGGSGGNNDDDGSSDDGGLGGNNDGPDNDNDGEGVSVINAVEAGPNSLCAPYWRKDFEELQVIFDVSDTDSLKKLEIKSHDHHKQEAMNLYVHYDGEAEDNWHYIGTAHVRTSNGPNDAEYKAENPNCSDSTISNLCESDKGTMYPNHPHECPDYPCYRTWSLVCGESDVKDCDQNGSNGEQCCIPGFETQCLPIDKVKVGVTDRDGENSDSEHVHVCVEWEECEQEQNISCDDISINNSGSGQTFEPGQSVSIKYKVTDAYYRYLTLRATEINGAPATGEDAQWRIITRLNENTSVDENGYQTYTFTTPNTPGKYQIGVKISNEGCETPRNDKTNFECSYWKGGEGDPYPDGTLSYIYQCYPDGAYDPIPDMMKENCYNHCILDFYTSSQAQSLMCVDLSYTPTAVRGQTLNFSCSGSGDDASYANFQVLKDGQFFDTTATADFQTYKYLTSGIAYWNWTIPSDAPAGNYLVQCQICNSDNQCTQWGKAN